MKKFLINGLVLAAGALGTLAYAASPSVVGSWNVSFFLEPARATGATQCIVFTLVPGTVGGVPTSGTWTSPTFPGWSGQWVLLGDHVRWFGVTSSLATSESGNMENSTHFGGVSFNHFSKATAATSSAGSWHGTPVRSCTNLKPISNLDDPSGDDPTKR